MKHMVRNDELLEKIGFDLSKPHPIIYSCEFDDGRKAQNVDHLRLGADGLEIWFFPCFSCIQQMRDYSISHLLSTQAPRHISDGRTIVYRGIVLAPYSGYEVPPENTKEWKDLLREIDQYCDEGKPMRLNGLEVRQLAGVKRGE